MKHLRRYESFQENAAGYLSDDEDKCLKQIYISLRDILIDFKKQASIYCQKNPGQLSISDFIKNSYRFHKNAKRTGEASSIAVDFDEIDPLIKKTFKSLQKEFSIKLVPKSEDAAIKSLTQPTRIKGMEIGTTKLFNYSEESFKSSLQHEIQHIANIEKEGVEKGDFDESAYVYLASKKETDSHAKQFAYLYRKSYPKDASIDLKKLREMDMAEKSRGKLNLYLWFMSPERFKSLKGNENMSDEIYEDIKRSGREFAERLKYYLGLFGRK